MSAALPAWADMPEGRELVAAILREQPSYYFTRGLWIEGGGARRYEGPTAGKLRRLHDATACRLFAEADEAFERGVPWNEAAAEVNACLAASPDKLIEQLLHEPLVEVEHLGPGRIAA